VACDPNTLLDQAKCLIDCIPPGAVPAVKVSMLCNILQFRSPQKLSGLIRWWRADTINLPDGAGIGGAGQEWRDAIAGQLGGQATAANQPTLQLNGIGGKPSVKSAHISAGVAQFLTLSSPVTLVVSGDFTLIIVLQNLVLASGSIHKIFNVSGGGATFIGESRDASFFCIGVLQDDVGAGSRLNFTFSGGHLGEVGHALIFRRSGVAANNAQAFYNQSQSLSGSDAAGVYTVDQMVNTEASFNPTGSFLTSEILLWNRALTDAELAALYGAYLKPRYALP
jgi:hypothetical protein